MKFTFTDKKVNIPNRVHTYAEKKIGKLDRYFQTEPETSIVFSVEKGEQPGSHHPFRLHRHPCGGKHL